MNFLVHKRVSNGGVAVAGGTVPQDLGLGAGFKTCDLVNEMLGGYRRTTLDGCANNVAVASLENVAVGNRHRWARPCVLLLSQFSLPLLP